MPESNHARLAKAWSQKDDHPVYLVQCGWLRPEGHPGCGGQLGWLTYDLQQSGDSYDDWSVWFDPGWVQDASGVWRLSKRALERVRRDTALASTLARPRVLQEQARRRLERGASTAYRRSMKTKMIWPLTSEEMSQSSGHPLSAEQSDREVLIRHQAARHSGLPFAVHCPRCHRKNVVGVDLIKEAQERFTKECKQRSIT